MAGKVSRGESLRRARRGAVGYLEDLGQTTQAVMVDVTAPIAGVPALAEAPGRRVTRPSGLIQVSRTKKALVPGTPLSEDAFLVAVELCPADEQNFDTKVHVTSSERCVLQLAAQGLSNAAIARLRGTSARTVANQLAASYEKLKVRGRRELKARLERRLVSGRWPVVECFDCDGNCCPLVCRNSPKRARRRPLSFRERQVMRYADLGHTNKLIAYSLGISLSTVSTLLTRARRKLGKHEIAPLNRV